ncbi:PP2C family protein-serine/threonine phosphatase [Aquipseudomonas alcaligenes]|jgi:serine/threonine-protein phosphatase Stp1|uniref:Serine/threonine phosphoprotein phosphatase Stp1 n=1 Tax=Aquipseudomonas alcaligenes TaxID=43263 RepID=A0AA37CDN9_AQUAC|nr:PP2C family serine/threonine-protein phosphatase [Pseudomonas alcaligenes]BCR26966.1 serine/threonine phosphoprotein phosphatase Stp1 [Pseudomonas alcaligenes]GIZ65439.1 serine/threonine phosphoprotein phosphatase Stp1 [Pseudomonas alcaligenes]GIZ69773.1 serine/threonine phosphoprotein phosphatase Stp1 [Pseudomonas alcaligenes]GIZ74125.1 serine/threonine phosphoprotein phosphatase Stp1 [Pseudomonas alcaligenes]GIZ81953.1 serine/threonine phosphoprotein phosphatase Stp1 [Pseudomonas alcalige
MKVAQRLWSSAGRTDTGKVRARNEDAFLDQPQQGLWVVADGMGGHQAGDLASRLIVESLAELPAGLDFEDRLDALRDCLHRLNRHLSLGLTLTAETPDLLVGSTVVALLAEGSRVACVWAGDSRCYLLRGRQLFQLSRDHSLLQQLVEERGMSPADAARQPGAHALTRAIGADEELQLDILELESLPGDVFLLCSDGLYQDLDHDLLTAALLRPSPQLALQRLFELALLGPARDNLSGVVINR